METMILIATAMITIIVSGGILIVAAIFCAIDAFEERRLFKNLNKIVGKIDRNTLLHTLEQLGNTEKIEEDGRTRSTQNNC